jgi:hypothetical protein
MARGTLPRNGEVRIGAVQLPAGRRILAPGSGHPVAWMTGQPVTDIPRAWAMLSDAHDQTGLVPVLLAGLDARGLRPWDSEELDPPADTAQLDRLDAAAILRSRWDRSLPPPGGADAQELKDRAPFSRPFPGLAPAQEHELSLAARGQAISSLQAAHLGLVPAPRPADVLPLVGWVGSDRFEDSLPIAAVLRSWEDRFGATLLEAGYAEIRLLVSRPPTTRDAAEAVAAEHFAFADECGGQGLISVSAIAASLIDAPFWSFWWD